MDWIIHKCRQTEYELLELRRRLHAVPEIGEYLPETQKLVCAYLDKIGVSYTCNPNDSGVIAEVCGASSGKTIAFRADMDGLHITEDPAKSIISSIQGQMHGCGHDAHTAILLVTAKILNEYKDRRQGTVRFLFQSAEETGTGAKRMIAAGALDGVDGICALHVGNLAGDDNNCGDFVVLPGAVTAGKDKFTITVRGKGTHSAFPEKGVDPIVIAARIVNACEEISARELPAGTAAVISFGSFQSGIDHNTIPDSAVLKGSIRVQDDTMRNYIGERMQTIAQNIAAAFRAECVVDIQKGSQTVKNDAHLSAFVVEAIRKALGETKVVTEKSSALMGSDDFANYAGQVPGVYFFLHTNNPEKNLIQANHNPGFDVDEAVLWEGVAAYVAIAMEFLK